MRHGFTSTHDITRAACTRAMSEKTTLLVSAKKGNQEAIEGCVFLQDRPTPTGNGTGAPAKDVVLVTQMKLHAVTNTSLARTALIKTANFMNRGVVAGPWAALYCATGTTDQFEIPKTLKRQLKYIILEGDGALELFSSLGKTFLYCRISDIESARH